MTRIEELSRELAREPEDAATLAILADCLEEAGDARASFARAELARRGQEGAALRAMRRTYPASHREWLRPLEACGAFEVNFTGLAEGLVGARGEERYRDLPPLPPHALDPGFTYLASQPAPAPAGHVDPDGWRQLATRLAGDGYLFPEPLLTLMTRPDLQAMLPSMTANYFVEPTEIDPIDGTDAIFVPFYSDQQSVVRWGVWLVPGERYAPILLGVPTFEDEPPLYDQLAFSSPSIEDFLYRDWITNHIWFATEYSHPPRPLTAEEESYARASSDAR